MKCSKCGRFATYDPCNKCFEQMFPEGSKPEGLRESPLRAGDVMPEEYPNPYEEEGTMPKQNWAVTLLCIAVALAFIWVVCVILVGVFGP